MNSGAKYFFFGILFTLFVFVAGYVIYSSGKSSPVPTISSASFTEPSPQPTTGPVVTRDNSQSPTITIDDSGGISEPDKNQIIQKVLNPYLDYYRDADQGSLVSLIVSLNTQPNNLTFPFILTGTFTNGGKNSFVIEKKGDDVSWWTPKCLGPCLLTDEFRRKYPEIVKNLGQ